MVVSLEGAVPSGQSRTDTPVSANPATSFVPISQSEGRKQVSGGAHRERSAVLNKHSLELTAAGNLIERNGHLILGQPLRICGAELWPGAEWCSGH